MQSYYDIAIAVVAIIGVFLLIKLLAAPIKKIVKLLLNALLGFIMLFIVNFLGSYIGFQTEITFLKALVAGLLGIPGVILLIILEMFF